MQMPKIKDLNKLSKLRYQDAKSMGWWGYLENSRDEGRIRKILNWSIKMKAQELEGHLQKDAVPWS